MYSFGLLVFTQIVLESFPISSSTHTMLLARILRSYAVSTPELTVSLCHIMHIPSIIVVGGVLGWWYTPTARHWKSREVRHHVWRYACMVVISTGITVVGYLCMRYCSLYWWSYRFGILFTAFILFTTVLSWSDHTPIHFWHALVLGIAQTTALLPGVSRLAVTYATGRCIGWSVKRINLFTLFTADSYAWGGCLDFCRR